MHKRILCLLLTAVMLLSLIPAFALPSQAASNMKTSEAAIEILKGLEGFSEFAYYDYSHYSIGYGTSCEKDEYPNGITEEEADALLREALAKMEEDVNRFATGRASSSPRTSSMPSCSLHTMWDLPGFCPMAYSVVQ